MNFPIAVLLLCAMLGLFDKIIGGRLGLAEEFETWNSDHLPLFFTVSVPDDHPGQ